MIVDSQDITHQVKERCQCLNVMILGNEVDQIFSILSQELKSEIKSLDELFEKLRGAPIIPKAEVEHFLFSWDWKTFIEEHLTDKSLANHSYYHQFQFVKDNETVKMRAKHLPQDVEWTPPTGIRLVKDGVDFGPVGADDFRIEKLDMPHVYRDLYKYFKRLPMHLRVKVSSSWDALRDTLESLPGRRDNLEKMKISDLPRQSLSTTPALPEEFQFVQERDVPALRGDIFPISLEEGDFDEEIFEGLDVVCYTRSKAQRPWLGRVTQVLPGQKFVINWYARKKGNSNHFFSMEENNKPYCSVQENACVILWGFAEQKLAKTFVVSNCTLVRIKSEYETYDKNGM